MELVIRNNSVIADISNGFCKKHPRITKKGLDSNKVLNRYRKTDQVTLLVFFI